MWGQHPSTKRWNSIITILDPPTHRSVDKLRQKLSQKSVNPSQLDPSTRSINPPSNTTAHLICPRVEILRYECRLASHLVPDVSNLHHVLISLNILNTDISF